MSKYPRAWSWKCGVDRGLNPSCMKEQPLGYNVFVPLIWLFRWHRYKPLLTFPLLFSFLHADLVKCALSQLMLNMRFIGVCGTRHVTSDNDRCLFIHFTGSDFTTPTVPWSRWALAKLRSSPGNMNTFAVIHNSSESVYPSGCEPAP